ncbi:MAG: prohibitin family protein [Rhodothermaceae bacterium]|nr:prohibitin family protein [Rhodothermaceae bacterium]
MANNYPNLTQAASRLMIGFIVVIIFILLAGGLMTTTLGPGQSGVKYSIFGGTDLDKQFAEGLQIHPPWVDIIKYDVRFQEKLEEITALSSDGLTIGMDASIRWRPVRNLLPNLHQNYGENYYGKLVQPELRSAAREIVGQYTPEELYSSRRTEMQQQIIDQVRRGVDENLIEVEAILIRNVKLPEQIQRAIENKLTEEQEVERYFFTLQKDSLEAQRKQIEADGQATYQRIITESLTPQFLRFKGIEATLTLAESPNTKTVIVGGGEDGLPLILGDQ